MSKKVRVAAIQAEPVWLDLKGGVRKVISLIKDAAKDGVGVLGFPELFVPGYPWSVSLCLPSNTLRPIRTMWTEAPFANVELINEYVANSLVKESPEMDSIRAAVEEAGIFAVLGYSERAGGSLYIAQSIIDPNGKIILHRRKIKPTGVERSIWGDGQADSLTCVVDSPYGRIGALNCWEHLQPLLRYYEYSQGVEIHVAGWPAFWKRPDGSLLPYHIETDAYRTVCQFMAMEGTCFVIVATQMLTDAGRDKLKLVDVPFISTPGGGFAMIYGPDGAPLTTGIEPGEEGIVAVNIDLSALIPAKQMLDVVGHYSRPDLLSLRVNKEIAKHVHPVPTTQAPSHL
jgi:nitrilase